MGETFARFFLDISDYTQQPYHLFLLFSFTLDLLVVWRQIDYGWEQMYF